MQTLNAFLFANQLVPLAMVLIPTCVIPAMMDIILTVLLHAFSAIPHVKLVPVRVQAPASHVLGVILQMPTLNASLFATLLAIHVTIPTQIVVTLVRMATISMELPLVSVVIRLVKHAQEQVPLHV